ncbi:MAG: AAA family ATPase [Cytophagales bacterium]|nr:AAA family ATPase [Armatimonadota bacterium]
MTRADSGREPPADVWEADLFGLARMRCGDRSSGHFPTRQAALLFAYLITYPRRHTRDELADLLWPDAEAGRPRLSLTLWRLRQALRGICPDPDNDFITADRDTIGIDSTRVTSDVASFRQWVQRAAKPEDAAARVEALEKAVKVYGDAEGFLPGYYDDWVLAERQNLLTQYLKSLEALASHFEALGDWTPALGYAERAVAAEPLREEAYRILIRILAASGQTPTAQRKYDDLVRLLARELNAEPSPATRSMMARMQQADTAPSPPLSAAVPAPLLRVAPVPAPLTTFYGRETFLRDLETMLDDPTVRLVSLLGTSGVGKTRLALELARGIAARSRSSAEPVVAFVPLADITESRKIAGAIADALTPPGGTPPLNRIMAALTAAPDAPPFLLVLDNADRLTDQVGEVAVDLLARIPRLRVLVTSQRPLGIDGEHEAVLPPLDLHDASPGAASPAMDNPENAPSVRLFLDRARSVRPGFAADAEGQAEVALLCERLDGLPLAIELCAGWAHTLAPRQMREMLAGRFDLLVSRRSDIPARHRTLRAAIEYGYVQLPVPLQKSFVQLASFRGGWTLAAAAEVCTGGSVPLGLAMLAQLRERSMIVVDDAGAGASLRYRMLESLRDFAVEQRTISQARQHREAHAAYVTRFVQETVVRIRGDAEDPLWSARLTDEMENVRAALEYLTARPEIEPAWTLTVAVADTWTVRGHPREASEWIVRSLAMEIVPFSAEAESGSEAPGSDKAEGEAAKRSVRLLRLRARLLTYQARALTQLGDYIESNVSAENALALWRELEDGGGMTECLREIGILALIQDDIDRAKTLFAEALPFARTLGDMRLASLLGDLGRVAMKLQDWDTASERTTEALEICRRLGNLRGLCGGLNNLGIISGYRGDFAAASLLLREAIALEGRLQITGNGTAHFNLAVVERQNGFYAESFSQLAVAIRLLAKGGDRFAMAWYVKEMGHLAAKLRQHALSLRLMSCAEEIRAVIGISFEPLGPLEIERDRAAGEKALGTANAAAYWVLGTTADPLTLLSEAQVLLAKCLTGTGNGSSDFALAAA